MKNVCSIPTWEMRYQRMSKKEDRIYIFIILGDIFTNMSINLHSKIIEWNVYGFSLLTTANASCHHHWKLTLKYFFSLKVEPKTKGLKQQQQQHKRLLAAMLSQDSFESIHSPTPSVTEEDIDNEDDAMELLGNFKN